MVFSYSGGILWVLFRVRWCGSITLNSDTLLTYSEQDMFIPLKSLYPSVSNLLQAVIDPLVAAGRRRQREILIPLLSCCKKMVHIAFGHHLFTALFIHSVARF